MVDRLGVEDNSDSWEMKCFVLEIVDDGGLVKCLIFRIIEIRVGG